MTRNFRNTQRSIHPKYIEKTFYPIQSTFRSLEINFKRLYKICICSGNLSLFKKLQKPLSVLFSRNF